MARESYERIPFTSLDSADVATVAADPSGAARASNVVTITTVAAHGFIVGQEVSVAGVVDSAPDSLTDYNGIFTIVAVPSATTFTYAQTGNDDSTAGGGTVQPTIGLEMVFVPYPNRELPLTFTADLAWGSASAGQIDIEGSLDKGVSWLQIGTDSSFTDKLLYLVDKPVPYIRARIISRTVGTGIKVQIYAS